MLPRAVPPTRLEAIQIGRAIAALMVVGVHSVDAARRGGLGDLADTWPALAVIGSSGVDLFFVISGFVMAHVIAGSGAAPGICDFLGRRIERIVPLFLLVSVAFILVDPFGEPFAWQSIAYSATILPVFDGQGYHAPVLFVGWTLGFEFAFYALVAIALSGAAHAAPRRAVWRLLWLTIGAALVGLIIQPGWAPLRLIANPLQAEFALGVGLWLLFDAGSLPRWAGVTTIVGVAVLLSEVAFGVGVPMSAHFSEAVSGISGPARLIDWGLPWALVLAGLIGRTPSGAVARLLCRIGDSSYSLYLTHVFAMAMAVWLAGADGFRQPVIFVGLAVGFALALGFAVHRYIERPLIAAFAARRRAPGGRVSPPVRPARSARAH